MAFSPFFSPSVICKSSIFPCVSLSVLNPVCLSSSTFSQPQCSNKNCRGTEVLRRALPSWKDVPAAYQMELDILSKPACKIHFDLNGWEYFVNKLLRVYLFVYIIYLFNLLPSSIWLPSCPHDIINLQQHSSCQVVSILNVTHNHLPSKVCSIKNLHHPPPSIAWIDTITDVHRVKCLQNRVLSKERKSNNTLEVLLLVLLLLFKGKGRRTSQLGCGIQAVQ